MRAIKILPSGTKHILRRRGDDVQHKKSVLILGHFFLFFRVRLLFFSCPATVFFPFFAQLIKLAILVGCPFRSGTTPPH